MLYTTERSNNQGSYTNDPNLIDTDLKLRQEAVDQKSGTKALTDEKKRISPSIPRTYNDVCVPSNEDQIRSTSAHVSTIPAPRSKKANCVNKEARKVKASAERLKKLKTLQTKFDTSEEQKKNKVSIPEAQKYASSLFPSQAWKNEAAEINRQNDETGLNSEGIYETENPYEWSRSKILRRVFGLTWQDLAKMEISNFFTGVVKQVPYQDMRRLRMEATGSLTSLGSTPMTLEGTIPIHSVVSQMFVIISNAVSLVNWGIDTHMPYLFDTFTLVPPSTMARDSRYINTLKNMIEIAVAKELLKELQKKYPNSDQQLSQEDQESLSKVINDLKTRISQHDIDEEFWKAQNIGAVMYMVSHIMNFAYGLATLDPSLAIATTYKKHLLCAIAGLGDSLAGTIEKHFATNAAVCEYFLQGVNMNNSHQVEERLVKMLITPSEVKVNTVKMMADAKQAALEQSLQHELRKACRYPLITRMKTLEQYQAAQVFFKKEEELIHKKQQAQYIERNIKKIEFSVPKLEKIITQASQEGKTTAEITKLLEDYSLNQVADQQKAKQVKNTNKLEANKRVDDRIKRMYHTDIIFASVNEAADDSVILETLKKYLTFKGQLSALHEDIKKLEKAIPDLSSKLLESLDATSKDTISPSLTNIIKKSNTEYEKLVIKIKSNFEIRKQLIEDKKLIEEGKIAEINPDGYVGHLLCSTLYQLKQQFLQSWKREDTATFNTSYLHLTGGFGPTIGIAQSLVERNPLNVLHQFLADAYTTGGVAAYLQALWSANKVTLDIPEIAGTYQSFYDLTLENPDLAYVYNELQSTASGKSYLTRAPLSALATERLERCAKAIRGILQQSITSVLTLPEKALNSVARNVLTAPRQKVGEVYALVQQLQEYAAELTKNGQIAAATCINAGIVNPELLTKMLLKKGNDHILSHVLFLGEPESTELLKKFINAHLADIKPDKEIKIVTAFNLLDPKLGSVTLGMKLSKDQAGNAYISYVVIDPLQIGTNPYPAITAFETALDEHLKEIFSGISIQRSKDATIITDPKRPSQHIPNKHESQAIVRGSLLYSNMFYYLAGEPPPV